MNAKFSMRVTWPHFLAASLVAMNLLLFGNLFIPGAGLSTLVLLPLAGVMLLYAGGCIGGFLATRGAGVSVLDFLICAYAAWSVCSVVLYLQAGHPASPLAYVYGLNVQVLPMTMYFAVRGLTRREFGTLLKLVVALHVFCVLVGIALFFVQPDFYTEYLRNRLGRSEDWQLYARLQSYLGSTSMGILSACAIVLLANVEISKTARYVLLLLFLLAIFLTQQRGAYISGILAAAYFLYWSRIGPLRLATVGIAMGAAFIALLGYLGLTTDFLSGIVYNRIVEDLILGDPMGERAVSWRKGLGFLSEFPLGLGLGATTSAATDAGAHIDGQVVDAYYMRVAADLGVQGLIMFLALVMAAGWAALKDRTVHGFAVIVVIFAFQSSGTNVLDSFYVSHFFWMLLGWIGATRGRAVVQAGDR